MTLLVRPIKETLMKHSDIQYSCSARVYISKAFVQNVVIRPKTTFTTSSSGCSCGKQSTTQGVPPYLYFSKIQLRLKHLLVISLQKVSVFLLAQNYVKGKINCPATARQATTGCGNIAPTRS